MTEASPRCYLCGRATSMQVLESVSGEETPLTLTLQGLPILVCKNGHRQFAHAKFAMKVFQHLANDGAKLPISNEAGRWFKRPVCADCGASLENNSSHVRTFRVDVPLAEATKFGIDLTMPVFRCRGCGKEQLRSRKELQGRAPAALVRALRAAGIAQE